MRQQTETKIKYPEATTVSNLYNESEHWVKITGMRMLGKYLDEDTMQAGRLGIWDAVQKYDPAIGAFSTFAITKIRGAMLEHVRLTQGYTRRQYDLSRQYQKLAGEFRAKHKRNPYDAEELAAFIGSTNRQADAMLESSTAVKTQSVSLDAKTEDGAPLVESASVGIDESAEDACVKIAEAETLRKAIEALPPRERDAMIAYYYGDISFSEVGKRMGISESRAFQLHGQAIRRLRWNPRLRAMFAESPIGMPSLGQKAERTEPMSTTKPETPVTTTQEDTPAPPAQEALPAQEAPTRGTRITPRAICPPLPECRSVRNGDPCCMAQPCGHALPKIHDVLVCGSCAPPRKVAPRCYFCEGSPDF